MRREIKSKDEEIRRLRKKSRNVCRMPLPYGNENIATMILRTLSNHGDVLTGASVGEAVPQYNKCQHCGKVFLNQLYLQSHVTRRHSDINRAMQLSGINPMAPNDLPEKMSPTNDVDGNKNDPETNHLRQELRAVQEKLRETESMLNSKVVIGDSTGDIKESTNINGDKTGNKENSTEINLIDKFEEWKKEENDKYRTEISELRKQLVENINIFKATALVHTTEKDELMIENLKDRVKTQENEIKQLKDELLKPPFAAPPELSKELQRQEETWRNRMESLERQHEQKLDQLLRTLETVYKEVKAAREMGETERAKVVELEAQLLEKENILKKIQKSTALSTDVVMDTNLSYTAQSLNRVTKELIRSKDKYIEEVTPKPQISHNKQHYNNITSKQSLEELHRKAQELLSHNAGSDSETSESLQESSSPVKLRENEDLRKTPLRTSQAKNHNKNVQYVARSRKNKKKKELLTNRKKTRSRLISDGKIDSTVKARARKTSGKENMKPQKETESDIDIEANDTNHKISSPVKVIRAKLSEEVNSRLLTLGVDPLRGGVPVDTFRKQQAMLQQSADSKAKKDATYSKMRNRIMTYLDSKVTKDVDPPTGGSPKLSPSKPPRNFKVSTIFSNVKHKALSFMKSSDKDSKVERSILNDEIAKKAALFLKTPPGSAPSSPENHRRMSLDSRSLFPDRVKRALSRMTTRESPVKKSPPKSQSIEVLYDKNKKHQMDDSESLSESESATSSSEFYKNKQGEVKVVTSAISHETSRSIEALIKSPMRKPIMFNGDRKNIEYLRNDGIGKQAANSSPVRTASAASNVTRTKMYDIRTDSEDDSDANVPAEKPHKFLSEETLPTRSSPTSTKGVLKNAPSISSLSKKKVLFDLEANQMKSVSASPSQSVTDAVEAPQRNEQNHNQIINVSNDWEVSSIEDIPVKELKADETLTLDSRRSPKIAELTQRIESQLARRPDVKKPVGAVEQMARTQAPANLLMSGSNTSLGSSLLDESASGERASPARTGGPVPAPRYVARRHDKDASDLDVSDWSIDDILKGK